MLHMPTPMLMQAEGIAPPGQQIFTGLSTSGTFIVPAGRTSMSAVCIGPGQSSLTDFSTFIANGGGGGLAYGNSFAVTPGEALSWAINSSYSEIRRGSVVLLRAWAGRRDFSLSPEGAALSGGFPGGLGGSRDYAGGAGDFCLHGAGAGGYTSAGEGGGGGEPDAFGAKGGGGSSVLGGGPGGGQKPYGSFSSTINGGDYGGGAGVNADGAGGLPGQGAIRFMWGDSRSFPSNAGDV